MQTVLVRLLADLPFTSIVREVTTGYAVWFRHYYLVCSGHGRQVASCASCVPGCAVAAGMLYAVEGTMQTAQGSNYGDGFLTGTPVAGKPKNDPAPFFNVRGP